jgi:hypothetical protein
MCCEVSTDYIGVEPDAIWEDWKVSVSTWFHWQRGTIVTDVQWMIRATKFFGLLFPGEWRVFPMDESRQSTRMDRRSAVSIYRCHRRDQDALTRHLLATLRGSQRQQLAPTGSQRGLASGVRRR